MQVAWPFCYENNQSFTSTGQLTSITVEAGSVNDTFNFNGHYGKVAISGYTPGSNTINFDHNDFANIAAVEAHATQDSHGNTLITLDANDVITLTGVSLSQFEAHTSDWHFI